jgi:hypothetical protein
MFDGPCEALLAGKLDVDTMAEPQVVLPTLVTVPLAAAIARTTVVRVLGASLASPAIRAVELSVRPADNDALRRTTAQKRRHRGPPGRRGPPSSPFPPWMTE